MAYPTTLALIAALWSGPARTKSIALWSALGGAIAALGPLVAGFLLQRFHWGSVFVITLPLAVVVGAAILGINFAAVPGRGRLALLLFAIAIIGAVLFILRQRRARSPLYDLKVAKRRIFWVAALAGIIVFGSLMGAMFIGQQYLQNVLGYSTFEAGAAIIPAAYSWCWWHRNQLGW